MVSRLPNISDLLKDMFKIKGMGKGKGKRFEYLEDNLRLPDYNVGPDSLLTWTDADEFDECDP